MEIIIKNESDAYELLDKLNKQTIQEGMDVQLKFDGWPRIDLTLRGESYNATLTPTIMSGLIDFQKSIYRTYAYAKYGTDNIQKLSKEEKDELEIQVAVKQGSSELGIDFQTIIEKFMGNLVGKMSSTELLIGVVTVAVLYFGHSAYKTYLENRRLSRQDELDSEEKTAGLEALRFANEQETQRTKLIVDLAQSYKTVQKIQEHAYEAQTDLLKSLRAADSADIAGVTLSGETATELVKNARKPSTEARVDGVYRVYMVDSSDPTAFKIKVKNVSTGAEFSALVQDETLAQTYRDIIQRAEWSRKPVKLNINAKMIGDEIRSAVVIGAEDIP